MQIKVEEDEIFECSDNFKVVATILLFDLAEKVDSSKDIYLRNSIAKAVSLLDSIISLYKKGYNDNAIILYRSLLDRLVYVYYLNENDLHQEFKFETLIANFEHVSNARSTPELKELLKDPLFQISKEERKRYQEYKKNSNAWTKPDAKKVLKDNDLGFLYKFGYEYSSRRVHPTYFDGLSEFHLLTDLKPNPFGKFENQIIINNALLITSVLVNECLSQSSFNFRIIVFNYFKSITDFLNGEGNKDYKKWFLKISTAFKEEIDLSK